MDHLNRDEKEVGTLVAGVVVPVAVEKVGEDLRLYLAVSLLLVPWPLH